MITNQIITREKYIEIQRTKDSYFDANKLLNIYNKSLNSKIKSIDFYKRQKSVKEYIKYLQEKELIKNPLLISKGRNSKTWMHPLLMIDFAMYLSLEFKTMVLKWALDGLIKTRHAAGDYYKEMCSTILEVYVDYYNRKPPALIYINEAKMIKSLVTQKQRNEMTEQDLKQITYLQKVNANLIKKRIGKETRIKRLIEASEIKI